MEIIPIAKSLGAEVIGAQLVNMDVKTYSSIEKAFSRYLVLCFRDQQLGPCDLVNLARKFGGVGETPYLSGLEDYPDVVPIVKEANEKSQHTFGSGWHTDFTFQKKPPARTLLYALDVPPKGGDTLFANLQDAYESLSTGMQESLSRLRALHSSIRSYGPNASLKNHLENMTITNEKEEPGFESHPVIRKHPVSGKPSLWVNPTYTIRFDGMTDQESQPLLDYLNDLITEARFTCRVNWKRNSLVMWDNRCTQHSASSDYAGHRREMRRITTAGDTPANFEQV
ncbi:MAG: TauD/TfdA dioxygenase family protein [Candidatus Azotimanducaceae bacterium]